MSLILTETLKPENIGIITLNNAARRNALSRQLVDDLLVALDRFEQAASAALILRAPAGSSVWSAGHDIKEIPLSEHDPLGYDDPQERLLRAVERYPGAVIAMVEGSVWGGACDLVLTCDIVIGDPTSSFAITPAKLGLPYNASGIMHFMNRLDLNIAKEMFFTADPLDAQRALQVGILNHLRPKEELYEFTLALAKRITSRSHLAISIIKEQFRILSNAYPLSPEAFERIQGLRRRIYGSHDYQEGLKAFLEKRQPVFQGN